MSDLRVVVAGAGGRMGRTILKAISEMDGLVTHAALEPTGAPGLGADAGTLIGLSASGVKLTSDVAAALEGAEALIDFTIPEASVALAAEASARGIAHIIGTTGCSVEEDRQIAVAAKRCAIVKSGNMSLGVNLVAALAKRMAQVLAAEDFDIEILEMHHNRKIDAPSGTALLLGNAVAAGRGIDLAERSVRSRDGHTGARVVGDIGFATLRGGTVVGDHTVMFAGTAERIELVHKADDRMIFARGALKAALWARSQPPGLYTMADVLGLGDI